MLCIGVVVFACVVTPRMAVDTFPELTPPVLVVGTLAPGLGPKDMEKTITWRIEKYVSATPGVDHVESTSRNNLSIVFVWMKWGTDLNAAQTLVQQQVQFAMAAVPKSLGVLPPFVLQYDPSNAPVVQVAVWGEGYSGPQLYDYAFNNIEPQLEGISGVASAALNGGRQRQINVIVDPVKSQARGLTAEDIAKAVAQSNALLPSGEFISPKFDANVYTNAIPKKVNAIGDADVKVQDGRPVLIRDVAKVEDGGSPATQDVTINGTKGVYLNVLRVPGGNTLEIVDAVKRVVQNLKNVPPGIHVKTVFDQSTFVRTTYLGLRKEVLQALLLIGLVILVFLQNPRAVLIAAIAIPVSFAIILIVLYANGQTLNAFTLGGLTLAMGPLVDISVVVIESIHRHRLLGKSPFMAALDGARSVAVPTLAATLTTTAVLLPVLLFSGLARKLFTPLALTVAIGMFAGYFVSMALTPVACRYLFGHHKVGRLGRVFETGVARVADGYASLLRQVLQIRFVLLGAVAVLVASSIFIASHLPSTFFPEIDESMERVYVRLAPGTSLEEATKQTQEMGKAIKDGLPPGTVELVLTNVGSPGNARSAMTSPNWGPHMGFIRVELVDPEHRRQSQRELSDTAREILNRRYPGVDFLQWPGGLVASVFSNGYFAPVVLEVRNDNLEELDAQAKAIAEVSRHVGGIRDVWVTSQMNYPEIHVDTDREMAGLVGVTLRDAAQTTLDAVLGNINSPSVWIDGANGQSYYVVTYYDAKQVVDPNALAQIPVRVGSRADPVTLGSYGHIWRSVGPIAVERNQLERASHIEMQTEGRDIGSAAEELEARLKSDPRTKNLRFDWVGQVALMRNTFSGLGLAIGLAIMVVFMIMASQFKSLRLPFIMLFTIPVSLVGIDLALMAASTE
jgi:multidrug efflux pump subunit AcrB